MRCAPSWEGATVGGVLAVGHSGLRRLGWGPVRDAVLEVRYVSAEGRLVKGGGPTVKNVSGYDLPRLFVGSLGTLGIIGEVVLRTRPVPAFERWYVHGGADPFELARLLYRVNSVLWDGEDDVGASSGDTPRTSRSRRVAQACARSTAPSCLPFPSHPLVACAGLAAVVARRRARSVRRRSGGRRGASHPAAAAAPCRPDDRGVVGEREERI